MGIASATEMYTMAINLPSSTRVKRKENFPDEVRSIVKYDNGVVAIVFDKIDLSLMEEAAKRVGFYTVKKGNYLSVYRTENKLPENFEDGWRRLHWYNENFITVYPDNSKCQFQHLFDSKNEENLTILDNYFRLKYSEERQHSKKLSSKITSFFQTKGNPERI